MPVRSVVAFRPAPPAHNPARASSMNPRLANTLVRLEAPVELPGRWDGPVYVRLGRETKHLPQGDTSEFSRDDDGSRRPGWYCKIVSLWPGQLPSSIDPDRRAILEDGEDHWIPFWRLTQPNVNLLDEDAERPLLSVFRFVRVSSYYLAAPRDDQRLIHVTSDVHVCGQVLAYSRIRSLTDSVGLHREPGSAYVCHVEIRRLATELSRVVAIPLNEVRAALISREEFVLGYYHGVPASVPVPVFTTPWASVLAAPGATTTATALFRSITMTFADADAPHGSTVLITGRDPIALVLPSGERTSVQPLAYIQEMVLLPSSAQGVDIAMDGDESPLPTLPLITRPETVISDWDQIPALPVATPGGQAPPPPEPSPTTGLQFFVPLSGQARLPPATAPSPAPSASTRATDTPAHTGVAPGARTRVASAPSTAVPSASDSVVQTLLQEQARQFTQMQAQFQAVMQAQLLAHAQAHKAELAATIAALTQRAPAPGAGADLEHRLGRSVSPRRDHSRSTGHRGRPRSPQRSASRPGRSPSAPRRARSRSPRSASHPRPPRGYRGHRSRSRSRSPSHERRRRSRSRSRARVHRSRSRERARRSSRSRSRDRHPRGAAEAGKDRVRLTPNQELVHSIAAVGPRYAPRSPGMDREFMQFTSLAVQDRIASMLQTELFRGQYPASKITTKMAFTVDYFSRPLDYFLASEAQPARHRAVLHDDTQWGGREPPPTHTISQADDLHRVLHSISDVASSWYTDRVATVFRTVHGHAVQHVRRDAPGAVLGAFINLYTKIFQNLFFDLVNGIHLSAVEGRALASLRDDSPEYRSIVHRVLQDTMMSRVFQHQHHGGANSGRQRPRERPHERRQPQGPAPTVIPLVIRNGIPEVPVKNPDGTPMIKDGKPVIKAVCLRFQAHEGCSFRSCKHVHELHKLPDDVLAWLKRHHGALKPQHPQK